MKFTKMQGTGNDFVVLEDLDNKLVGKEKEIAIKLCDRHFGIGGDGILLVRRSDVADIQMVIINADGSYAAMCGNGIRCFAKYVRENNIVSKDKITIETGDGVKEAILKVEDEIVSQITIDMGSMSFEPEKIPAIANEYIIDKNFKVDKKEYKITSMLMGVPHTVVFGKLDEIDINEGKGIEQSHDLFPEGTNVNFCEIIDENTVKVKTWERGAGPTLACGTGCCASVAAANKLGYTGKKVKVFVPGGCLNIDVNDNNVYMGGPAAISFKGEINI